MPQFDLESPIAYYGSYNDDIITGSMLPNGHRGYVGSYVSGNMVFLTAKTSNEFFSLYTQRDAGSFSRNIRFFSREIMYDTLIPDIFDIYKANGGKIVFSEYDAAFFPQIIDKKILKLVFGTYRAVATGSGGAQVSDNKWFGSFPFMHDYAFARRLTETSVLPFNSNSYIEISNSPYTQQLTYSAVTTSVSYGSHLYYLNIAKTNNAGLYTPDILYDREGVSDIYGNFIPTSLSQSYLRNKDLFSIIFGSKVEFVIRLPIFGIEFDCFAPIIRGWKYGLANAFQIKTSAIFRRNHFGQYRDMLEQRPYTKNYVRETKTTSSPLKISFVSGSDAALTASNPSLNTRDSGIFDYEYKTGQPWMDI